VGNSRHWQLFRREVKVGREDGQRRVFVIRRSPRPRRAERQNWFTKAPRRVRFDRYRRIECSSGTAPLAPDQELF